MARTLGGHSTDTRRTQRRTHDGHCKNSGFSRERDLQVFIVERVSIGCAECLYFCSVRRVSVVVSVVCLSCVRRASAIFAQCGCKLLSTQFLHPRVEGRTPRCQHRKSFSWSANLCSHILVRLYVFGGGARPKFVTKTNCKR